MITPPQPVAITAGILIGGHSRRMGRPKAVLTTPDGRTWLEQLLAA